MNKQIEKFEKFIDDAQLTAVFEMFESELEKFAQLIVQECEEELNDKRRFCYAVEQALDGLKGDYIEIIKELRKECGK